MKIVTLHPILKNRTAKVKNITLIIYFLYKNEQKIISYAASQKY